MTFKIEKFIPINFGDPVTALCFSSKSPNLAFGTAVGRHEVYNYKKKQSKQISSSQQELIRGMSFTTFEGDEQLNIIVGDLLVHSYKVKLNFEQAYKISIDATGNYDRSFEFSSFRHKQFCERSFPLIFKDRVMIFMTNSPQKEELEEVEGAELHLGNQRILAIHQNAYIYEVPERDYDFFTVPFDFDGVNMIVYEYLKNSTRRLSIISPDEVIVSQDFTKNSPVISFAKFVNQNEFIVVENDRHICNYSRTEKILNKGKLGTHKKDIIGVNVSKIPNLAKMSSKSDKLSQLGGGYQESKDKVDDDNDDDIYPIDVHGYKNVKAVQITFDQGGNFKVYDHYLNSFIFEFNIYKCSNYPKEQKGIDVFSMGYPYYLDYQEVVVNGGGDDDDDDDDNESIKNSQIEKRLIVSSDVGVFLIRLE